MIALASEIARIALGEVGVREEGGNNLGARVQVYQRATWLEPGPWPWCAAFAAWVLREALKSDAGQAYLQTKHQGLDGFRCHDASAFGWLKWAGQHGLLVLDSSKPPRAGDVVIYSFSHAGFVVSDALSGEHVLHSVEGNVHDASADAVRDNPDGADGVWRKTRDVKLVRAYIRIEA